MGKAVGKILIGAAIIGAAFVTGGASLVPSLSVTATVGGTVLAATAAAALSTTALGAIALGIGSSLVLAGASQATAKTPKTSLSQLDRLNATLVPSAPRKIVFGSTAMATDIRYVEPSGTDQEYIDYIIAVASHAVASIDEIWLEDTLAWRASGGAQGKYVGYLTVDTRLEGSAANAIAINGGAKWGSNRRLTGCAYIHLRIKRTGNGKKAESPFAGGLPGRMTIIGSGAKMYDPRRDSTVPGGSGPMRAGDQSTWAYTAADGSTLGENLALQTLWYLLGWRINGKLAVGRGIPPARLDLASFAVAANLCDEGVQLAAGGSEPRYWGAGVVSEADDPASVFQTLMVGCNGRLRDGAGRLALAILHNDLALAAIDEGLGDDDVLGSFTWNPDPSLEQSFNIVRGRYTDPGPNSLYQPVSYPDVVLPSVDGIDRILTLDLLTCESAARAQRLAKQTLQRKQYQRSFSAVFGARAWKYRVGDVVPLTFAALGFSRRLFRVEQQTIQLDGTCPMVLTEENAQIYAWDKEDKAPVLPAEPVRYDSRNNPLILAIGEAGVTYRGAWSSSNSYVVGDLVSDQGAVWSARAPSINQAPPTLPTEVNDYWQLFLKPGDASAALALIERIQSDGWLSRSEKPEAIRVWQAIADETTPYNQRAALYGISTELANFNNARDALSSYLNSLSPTWSDTSQDTPINGPTFRGKFTDYFYARVVLEKAIEAAQRGITDALSTAITIIASDNVLARGEKSQTIQIWLGIAQEAQPYNDQAVALGVGSTGPLRQALDTFNTARNALASYLNSLTPSWSDTSQHTPIDGPTFRGKFVDYAAAKAALEKALKDAQKAVTDGISADIAAIVSDNILSRDEKRQVNLDFYNANITFQNLATKYQQLGSPPDLTPSFNTASDKLGALNSYMNSLSPGYADTSANTPINGTLYATRWNEYRQALSAFEAAITGRPGPAGASALSFAIGPGVISLNLAASGAIRTGELPKTFQCFTSKGAADTTEQCSYTIATSNCTASVSNDAGTRGKITLTAVSNPQNASFTVTATHSDGSIGKVVVATGTARDGNSGGGGGAGQTVQGQLGAGPIITVSVPALSSLTVFVCYYLFSTGGSGDSNTLVQYRVAGSGSSFTDSGSTGPGPWGPGEPAYGENYITISNSANFPQAYEIRQGVNTSAGGCQIQASRTFMRVGG